MNKGLDALDRLEQAARGYCGEYAISIEDLDRGIFKEDAEAVETIRRELKTFEIVKECLVAEFKLYNKDGEYFIVFHFDGMHELTFKLKDKSEYDLLRGELE